MKARTCLCLLVLMPLLIACPGKPRPQVVPEGETREFRNVVAAAPIPIKGRLDFRKELLPPGARGKFASFDGDSFIINLPPRESGDLSAQQVFDQTIAPLVRAMGFGNRLGELRPGNSAGEKLPRASLRDVAAETCREVAAEGQRRFQPVCQALSTGESNPIAEQVIRTAYDMSLAQFRADFEREKTHYVFAQQAVQDVPIEHIGLVAERNDGEAVTSVYGTLFNRYGITNSVRLNEQQAVEAGEAHVLKFRGIAAPRVPVDRRKTGTLVLLPYGSAPDGSIGLRYAYRALIFAEAASYKLNYWLSWMAWIDADNGSILELAPQFDDIAASGIGWRRDPNTTTQTFSFQVDPSAGGQYILQRAGVLNRLDRLGDSAFDDDEVSISDSSGGSTGTFANFNQAPLNDSANAICAAGGNNTFRQVNAFIHLNAFRQMVSGAGTFPTFPENAMTVRMDLPQEGNSAGYDSLGPSQHLMNLATGAGGFTNAACPDFANGVLSASNDVTGMTHEFTHISTKRLQERRPADWCGMPGCMMPNSSFRAAFHDFADAWAHHYASTPWMGGWYRKNMGGADVSENCASHTETGGLPRLASVNEPFNTATILDHFPERRATFTGDYQDGQIVAAGMWLTRQGMRSKCLPSGTPQTWLRINRALYNSGFILNTCGGSCDRDIYRFAQNLLQGMAQQWATAGLPGGPPGFAHNGNHTTNKLLSGWARVGIFLVPSNCIDGDAATDDPTFCPAAAGGENGGDAIIDVTDNDPGDDLVIDQIQHPEFDWSQRGDVPPTFRAWTGPRFKFNAMGVANTFTPSMGTPSPCNTKFRVELASDAAFTVNVVNSPWTDVSTTAQPECYGTWTPDAADWTTLSGVSGAVRVYYRLRTRDAADLNEKISTSPGSGSYTVPPSYLVVNAAGQP